MANKAFPQFTKTIVQLPIPSATMTKAEYKAKYGIDLNAIDFPKIIILVDGKDKYPVDEIRVVGTTTEIYAGGKILSIGSSNVSVTSDAYSVANAKPIYIHPIVLMNSTTTRLSLLIFNNDPTPFTKDTFIDWLDELYLSVGAQTRILTSGAFVDGSNNVVIASYIGKTSETVYYFQGCQVGSGISTALPMNKAELSTFIDTFADGVNKIN